MRRSNLIVAFIIALFTLALQMPFIQADPDIQISGSRDANTDEGLYTCQIRNLINHHDLTLTKSDSFVKTPLFGAVLYIPFQFFGTTLTVGRLMVLLISLLICLFIFSYSRNYSRLGLIALFVVLTEYHVFHFFHFCMAEILCATLIFMAIFIIAESDKKIAGMKSCIVSATLVSAAYFVKIQFLYAIMILPLSLLVFLAVNRINRKAILRQLFLTTSFLLIFLALYILIWYLPNRDFFNYVMENQTSGRFAQITHLGEHLHYIINAIFLSPSLKLLTLSFVTLSLTGIGLIIIKRMRYFQYLFIGLSIWIAIEIHKLTMVYLPTRYLISLFLPMGLSISLVLWELINLTGKGRWMVLIKTLSIALILAFGIVNATAWYSSLEGRTFNIRKVNHYLSAYDFRDRPIVGAWAPSLGWNCKAITFPVWKNYFNDKNVIENYNPAIIIAETDEEDSNQAFSARGVDLNAYADSVKTITINRWTIELYWIRQDTGQKHNSFLSAHAPACCQSPGNQ